MLDYVAIKQLAPVFGDKEKMDNQVGHVISAAHGRGINAAINVLHHGILKLKAEGLSVSAGGGGCNFGIQPVAA